MYSVFSIQRTRLTLVLLATIFLSSGPIHVYAETDFVLEGVYEAALDLPRILFLLKREPTGLPLTHGGRFEVNYAFLDTGASGIVLSRETADNMRLQIHPEARFYDIGVGGVETFAVSEPLYIGLARYDTQNPRDPGMYGTMGPGRFQIKKSSAGLLGQPLDVVGMPVMIGRVAVLNSGATNSLEYFAADIKGPGDPRIPKVDFKVPLRLRRFLSPQDPTNIPPLPVQAPNPVIDNIVIYHKGRRSRGNWLLDTGATISLVSTEQAVRLGLADRSGQFLATPDFSLPLGGIGKMIQVPGFEIDALVVPTLSGRRLVFKNARLGVHDIKYYDRQKRQVVALDGVFASNFLCASAKMAGLLPADVSETMFDKVVIDMPERFLGFAVSRRLRR